MRGLLQKPWLAALILALPVALVLSSAGFARRGNAASPADVIPSVAVTGSTAEVSAFADDGTHNHPRTNTIPGSNFETFNNAATASDNDNSNDRGGTGEVTQNTTIKSPTDLAKITSAGKAKANYFADEFPQDPTGKGSSKLSVSFTVTGGPRPFKLEGTLTATSVSTVQCTTVTVTSPTGDTFKAAAPASCGAPSSATIEEQNVLQPGSYTFSVEAVALANNPDSPEGSSGSADARFDLALSFCDNVPTSGDDTVTGTPGDDILCGGGGNDTINALGGNDTIYAGDGNDAVDSGPGDDTIYGGAGNDGSPGGTSLYGGDGADKVFGGDGNDFVGGGAGDDALDGGAGNDKLDGQAGSDKLIGDAGKDALTGGPGKDVLNGGSGNDTLRAKDRVKDTVIGGPNRDIAYVDRVDHVTGVEVVKKS